MQGITTQKCLLFIFLFLLYFDVGTVYLYNTVANIHFYGLKNKYLKQVNDGNFLPLYPVCVTSFRKPAVN